MMRSEAISSDNIASLMVLHIEICVKGESTITSKILACLYLYDNFAGMPEILFSNLVIVGLVANENWRLCSGFAAFDARTSQQQIHAEAGLIEV